MSVRATVLAAILASTSSSTIAATSVSTDPRTERPARAHVDLADRKGPDVDASSGDRPLLATLVQVHTGEHVPFDAEIPTQARFDALMSDRVTGDSRPLDEHLLGLLRQLAQKHPGSRIELVSGYRSWKMNEMLRKKGHHVSSHSQHSLGHACDFRIVPPNAELALDPRFVEREIRDMGWQGGVGTYPTKLDWFVHADVGRNRRWVN